MSAVTVTLSNSNYGKYEPIAKEGDIIKVKGKKRLRLIVTKWHQDYEYGTITTKKAYAPSPRSRLKTKTIFSKLKIKIIKP